MKKEKKSNYEIPKLVELSDLMAQGATCTSGSSAAGDPGTCSPGINEGCIATGNTATGACGATGNSVTCGGGGVV